MQVNERTAGDIAVLTVSGDLTLKTMAKTRQTILHDKVQELARKGHRKVVVNLAAVPHIDSAGLGELLQAQATLKSAGGSLKLSNPSARLRELMAMTNLTKVLSVHDEESEALDSFRRG